MRVVATCVVLSCMVAFAAAGRISRQVKLPSSFEVNLALNDRATVLKALACVRGYRCSLPYGDLLRKAGPELIQYGTCNICSPSQEKQAIKIIRKIAREYPIPFSKTVQSLQPN